MYREIWEYRIRKNNRTAFEAFFDSKGEWSALCRKNPGYQGTDLLESEEGDNIFLSIDTWDSEDDARKFRQQFAGHISQLEEKLMPLVKKRERVWISG